MRRIGSEDGRYDLKAVTHRTTDRDGCRITLLIGPADASLPRILNPRRDRSPNSLAIADRKLFCLLVTAVQKFVKIRESGTRVV